MARPVKNADRLLSGNQYSRLVFYILQAAIEGAPKVKFVQRLLILLAEYSGCDAGLWLHNGESYRAVTQPGSTGDVPVFDWRKKAPPVVDPLAAWHDCLKDLPDAAGLVMTEKGSIWTNNASILRNYESAGETLALTLESDDNACAAFALIPFQADTGIKGALRLSGAEPLFSPTIVALYEDVAMIVGTAFQSWRNTWTLQERVKEMSCLYGLAQVFDSPEKDMKDILTETLGLIPPAWLYADIAQARITFDDQRYATPGFRDSGPKLSADIVINGERRGAIDVVYAKDKPDLDEGPFLKEERKLLDAIAKELSVIIERKLYEAEKIEIMERLRQADRLSMVGQLAASVAHEVNEPLTSILGFAQLVGKCPGLPAQASADVDKIVRVSLHAREVVRKLLLFTRKMPSRESDVDLNQVAREALSFFEHRCAREKIEVKTELGATLPNIAADPGQIRQVVVNLVVNAMQAMPQGGRLTVTTFQSDRYVELSVEDTGAGMDKETLDKVFIPFFTTKPAGMGTGLGLPVAREIVADHKGEIHLTSSRNAGTRVHIRLPKTQV